MTMVTKHLYDVRIYMAGSGIVTIDWGNSKVDTFTLLPEYKNWRKHCFFFEEELCMSEEEPCMSEDLETKKRHRIASIKQKYFGQDSRIQNSRIVKIVGENITHLHCSNSKLTYLNVSENTALKYLICDHNKLINLDVHKNKKLTELNCRRNQLMDLYVGKNQMLTNLDCSGNQLTSLDVSESTILSRLICYRNPLTSLDVSRNTKLSELDCSWAQLTNLDVSENTALTSLIYNYNQLDSPTVNKQKSEKPQTRKKTDNGFADIVGMSELKTKLKNEVIDLLNDPEGAKLYNLPMPNGMLLYGPPGCGKTFFAKKFAEETQFNYKYVNPSELASIYVHGSQEKIGELFKEARRNAPFIICLDEVSSILPKRDNARDHHQIGEVDEFLTQINNCGEDGVFVIATTNFPQNIDEALLRAGRLGIKIYVSPPDYEARKGLFEMLVKKIPNDSKINFDELANLTENYVTSDIRAIVEAVAHGCRESRANVTMDMLVNNIKNTTATVSIELIKKHEKIRSQMEGKDTESVRTPIGFPTQSSVQ
ncbi:MAG: AAA family ATPase [Lentimicrobiaceae bacterium]|nr:AAA family ATPase [Lentimicrobiaceae bacterium]